MQTNWPSVSYETLPWERDADTLALIPKSQRRKILSTYEAAVVPHIADCTPELSSELLDRMQELEITLARFDERMAASGFNLPSLLLRSESSSSSQIENLTSSARNIALAEISPSAPKNAQLISQNVQAMKTALTLSDDIHVDATVAVWRVLMNDPDANLRKEQVWIGGTPYSPHSAQYVPPSATHVRENLEDFCAFAARDDLPPIAKAAIAHAQFEAIHPFYDGNGRTGRTLLHKMLRRDGVLGVATLPVSAGLLHNIDAYIHALSAYYEGSIEPIITCLIDALDIALILGERTRKELNTILERWHTEITDRSGAAIHRLPTLLVEHPVVDTKLIAEELNVTPRAARNMVERAEGYGMLRAVGSARRSVFYQSDELIDLLNELSDTSTIRRIQRD